MKERSKELLPLAALPMYDFPELAWATDALWAAIAGRLGVSVKLVRGRDLQAVWTNPALLLAQTCGYPLVTNLRDKVRLLATPCYTAPGCEGPFYRSAIIVRREDPACHLEDLRDQTCAINDLSSNSGMNMLRAEIAPLAREARFFGKTIITGAHAASAAAVANGTADVAAIDCVTWAHLSHLRPAATESLRVLNWTPPSPGLPLISSVLTDPATCAELIRALEATAHDPALAPVRRALLLNSFSQMPLASYDALLALEQIAITAGYPILQ